MLAGGLGNRMFEYAFARAYAEKIGAELRLNYPQGEVLHRIFGIAHPPAEIPLTPVDSSFFEEWDGRTNITILGMGQMQKNLLYTRAQAREWFTLRPELQDLVRSVPSMELVANVRLGDYTFGCNPFTWISDASYFDCCEKHGLDRSQLFWLSSEDHYRIPQIPVEKPWVNLTDAEKMSRLDYLPDLALMMRAKTLLRSNSTFAWWAAALGAARVFCPDVSKVDQSKGVVNGNRVPQFVPFVEGNHMPVIWDLSVCSELFIKD